jgi:hypothetical protein
VPDHDKRSNIRKNVSNRELAERIDLAMRVFCDSLLDLRKQQEELVARIAFVMPTEGDIAREVDDFITKSLAA